MSDSNSENNDELGNFDDLDDGIDEELMALAGPPPGLKYGLFTLVVIGLLVGMMVWFFERQSAVTGRVAAGAPPSASAWSPG